MGVDAHGDPLKSTQCSAGPPARARPPSDLFGMSIWRAPLRPRSALPHRLHLDLHADPHLEAELLAEVHAVLVALEVTLGIGAAAVLMHHRDLFALEGADGQRQRASDAVQSEITHDLGGLAVDEVRQVA